jgi:hypothetical protein
MVETFCSEAIRHYFGLLGKRVRSWIYSCWVEPDLSGRIWFGMLSRAGIA